MEQRMREVFEALTAEQQEAVINYARNLLEDTQRRTEPLPDPQRTAD